MKNKGIALLIVLSTILVIVLLANIILTVMLSNTRLTQHQISRIQAYYAAQAGMNYALEKLRIADPAWTPTICKSTSPCSIPAAERTNNFPTTIQSINIILTAPGALTPAGVVCSAPANGACVTVNVEYNKPPS